MSVQGSAIVVGTNGFVWYAENVTETDSHLFLSNAKIIRNWGTTKGLAELVSGPTSSTVLDTQSDVVVNRQAFVFLIPCKTW